MDIQDTRRCNTYNLATLGKYYGVPSDVFHQYYRELLDDAWFLEQLNIRLEEVPRHHGFAKGIFAKGKIDGIDWFAYQRVLLYCLVRHLKPKHCLETGVFYGGNTAFILNALRKNGSGELISIDLPDSDIREILASGGTASRHPLVGDSEYYDSELSPGFLVPESLRNHWKFIRGNSHQVIPSLANTIDFYVHDSDHSFGFLLQELNLVQSKMSPGGTMVVDDLPWSNAFFKFCVDHEHYPLLATDNGKDNLQVRTGIVFLGHQNRQREAITRPEPLL